MRQAQPLAGLAHPQPACLLVLALSSLSPAGRLDVSDADEHARLRDQAHSSFVAAQFFSGAKTGYVFKMGDQGLGYYIDTPPEPANAPVNVSEEELTQPATLESAGDAAHLLPPRSPTPGLPPPQPRTPLDDAHVLPLPGMSRPATPTLPPDWIHAADCPLTIQFGSKRVTCNCGHGRNRWTDAEEKRAKDLFEAGNDYDAIASALNRDVHGGAEIRNANAVRNKIYRPNRPAPKTKEAKTENTGTNAGSSSDSGDRGRRGLAPQPLPLPPVIAPPPPPLAAALAALLQPPPQTAAVALRAPPRPARRPAPPPPP